MGKPLYSSKQKEYRESIIVPTKVETMIIEKKRGIKVLNLHFVQINTFIPHEQTNIPVGLFVCIILIISLIKKIR